MEFVSHLVRAHSKDNFKCEGNAVNTSAVTHQYRPLFEFVSHDKRNKNVDSEADMHVGNKLLLLLTGKPTLFENGLLMFSKHKHLSEFCNFPRTKMDE